LSLNAEEGALGIPAESSFSERDCEDAWLKQRRKRAQQQASRKSPADAYSDVGLNNALREELLFWTMLGMRTAATKAHEEWTTMDKVVAAVDTPSILAIYP